MTDKSARDEIARHYGAYEIGGSLDDMHEFERERCYDFADRQIAALEAVGLAVVPVVPTRAEGAYGVTPRSHRLADAAGAIDAVLRAAIPEGMLTEEDADLPSAEDVRGILKPEGN